MSNREETILALVNARSENEARRIVAQHPELLHPETDAIMQALAAVQKDARAKGRLEWYRALLARCRARSSRLDPPVDDRLLIDREIGVLDVVVPVVRTIRVTYPFDRESIFIRLPGDARRGRYLSGGVRLSVPALTQELFSIRDR